MTEYTTFWGGFSELFAGGGIPLFLSVAASFVRYLRTGWKSLRYHLGSLATSIFVGQVIFWFGLHHGFDIWYSAGFVTVGAYGSTFILDAIIYRLRKEIREGLPLRHKGEHHD